MPNAADLISPVTPPGPDVEGFFHQGTHTVSYIVRDPESNACAVIDSVLDYDGASGRTSTEAAKRILRYIDMHDLDLTWILETHAHADHLSAASYLSHKTGAPIAIGDCIQQVQKTFSKLFNLGDDFPTDGSQFDRLLKAGETFSVGNLEIEVVGVPGHTGACSAYKIGDSLFVGDTLFMPDYGTARCDFPGGDAATLYRSVQRLYELPDETKVYLCHDYLPATRTDYQWQTTIGEQKRSNIHISEGVAEAEFVAMRNARDATLSLPRLLIPSIQVNIRAGHMPEPESNGTSYLKIPVNLL